MKSIRLPPSTSPLRERVIESLLAVTMSHKAIIFYDIPGNVQPSKAWVQNTQKTRCVTIARYNMPGEFMFTRYTLNYKGLPYRTMWVEYPDIG
jgi:hypothetical protein